MNFLGLIQFLSPQCSPCRKSHWSDPGWHPCWKSHTCMDWLGTGDEQCWQPHVGSSGSWWWLCRSEQGSCLCSITYRKMEVHQRPGMPVRAFSQPRFPIYSWDSWLLKAMDIWRASGIHRSKVSKEYWQYRIRKYFLSVSLKKALWHCWTAFVAIAEVNIALKGVSAVNALGLCLSWGTNDSGIETTFTARM